MNRKPRKRLWSIIIVASLLFVFCDAVSYLNVRSAYYQEWCLFGGQLRPQFVLYPPSCRVLFYLQYPLGRLDKLITGTEGYLGRSPAGGSDRCPACGSTARHRMEYGICSEGGCMVGEDSPQFKCDACGFKWLNYKQPLPPP